MAKSPDRPSRKRAPRPRAAVIDAPPVGTPTPPNPFGPTPDHGGTILSVLAPPVGSPPPDNGFGPPPDEGGTALAIDAPPVGSPPPRNPFGRPPRRGTVLSLPQRYDNHPLNTGRKLVRIARDETAAAAAALHEKAGIRHLHPADMGAAMAASRPAGAGALPEGEGVVFEELGIAIVNAAPDRVGAVSMAAASAPALTGEEWERFVFALGGGDFLRGYQSAVNHLVQELGDAGWGGQQAAAAAALRTGERFEDTLETSWGLKAVRAERTRFTGRGIRVAVLDTGIDAQHRDMAARITASQSFVPGVPVQDIVGHGTHCAGTAAGPLSPQSRPRYGVATDALLHAGKVLGDDGIGTDTSILAGIVWALRNRCEIVSMSLGAPVARDTPRSRAFEQVGRRALAAGTLIVAAAGNDSRRPGRVAAVSHPANCRSFMAVAAVDSALNVAWFSNAGLNPDGGQIDIAGPGVDVHSAWSEPTGTKLESGTSMATPHVAGVAALIAEQDPDLRGFALWNRLVATARRLPAASADVGAGLVQAPV